MIISRSFAHWFLIVHLKVKLIACYFNMNYTDSIASKNAIGAGVNILVYVTKKWLLERLINCDSISFGLFFYQNRITTNFKYEKLRKIGENFVEKTYGTTCGILYTLYDVPYLVNSFRFTSGKCSWQVGEVRCRISSTVK